MWETAFPTPWSTSMKKLPLLLAVAIVAAGAGSAIAASGIVGTGHSSLGTVLTGPNGHTLYLFEGDAKGHLGCTGKCLGFWPPLTASGKLTASGTAKTADLGLVSRGSFKQVTYNGHPVYYFVSDRKPGQVLGQRKVLNGRDWYVISASGAAMTASASSGSGPSSSSGSGGAKPGW